MASKPINDFQGYDFAGVGLGVSSMDESYLEFFSDLNFSGMVYDPNSSVPLLSHDVQSHPVHPIICDEPWSIMSRHATPVSDGSNSSSNSAYNRSPPSTVYPPVTEQEITHIIPQTNFDPIADLRIQTPVSSEIPPASTNLQNLCTEGCFKRSFGRPYDLYRHINEQHRCPSEAHKDAKFRTPQERRDHIQRYGCRVGFWCGTCELNGRGPKSLTRVDKLGNHFRDVHRLTGKFDVRKFACDQEPCSGSPSCGGVFFTSAVDLKEHIEREHALLGLSSNSSDMMSTNITSPLHVETSNAKPKHGLDQRQESTSKRSKTDGNETTHQTGMGPPRANVIQPPQSIPSTGRNYSSGYDSLGRASQPLPENALAATTQESLLPLSETLPLSIIGLHSLIKQNELKDVIAKLELCEISPTFDCKIAAVKLSGKCSKAQMHQGKTMLIDLIERSNLAVRPMHENETPSSDISNQAFQQVSVYRQPKMSALDPEEDAAVLTVWHQYLLPQFRNIVKDAFIQGKYSAVLVRQHREDGIQFVIRFRSSENQGTTSRLLIQQRVHEICEQHKCVPLIVQFTEGSLVRLVGSSAPPINDPPNDQRFPHQRRPWKKPGMGASVALSHCRDISATLGGYIWVDGVIYMLSVDHFISKCRCQDITNADSLRSPSIRDVNDVRRQLKRKLRDLELKIRISNRVEVPLSHAEDLLDPINEELVQYQRIHRELEDDQRDFVLGKIRYRCGTGEHPLKPAVHPRLEGEMRRMDWSLTEITEPERQGKNVHRHRRINEPQVEDLSSELTKPYGSGIPCEQVREVRGGERVHYVGTTSGLREGTVDPGLMVVGDEDNCSYEWCILVDDCETFPDSTFKGDSGAFILGDDNKLVGQLWGWEDGCLLFTPIEDVFEDIKRRLGCQEVRLPEFSVPNPPSRSPIPLCLEVGYSPDSTTTEKAPTTPVRMASPRSRLLSPSDIANFQRRRSSSASTVNGGRLSTVPSLVSVPSMISSASSTSLFEDLCPKVEDPPLQELPRKELLQAFKDATITDEPEQDKGWQFVQQDELPDEDAPWESVLQLRIRSDRPSRYATV